MQRVNTVVNHLTNATEPKKICMIVGMGLGISMGTAIVFGQKGFTVVMVRRNGEKLTANVEALKSKLPNGKFIGIQADARKEDEVKRIFKETVEEHGIPNIVVYNIGANVPCLVEDETSRKFMKIWEMACFSGFLVGKEATSYMQQRGTGTIIFTGATGRLKLD